MKGNQYLTTTRSGLSLLSELPTAIQLRGLTELIFVKIGMPVGGGSSEYCVVPGNKNEVH
jgi:hypothetical protein